MTYPTTPCDTRLMCMYVCRCLYGGASRGPQGRELSRSPQLVIATPGRLLDFVSSGELSLNRVSGLPETWLGL
jgi:superfamily II DNA/RNA helicase